MMSKITSSFILIAIFSLQIPSHALNSDGTALLALKYAVLSDPLSFLHSWNYSDATPCSWNGVVCAAGGSAVVSLALTDSRLVGSIPPDLGLITHLQSLDLSGNFFNGTLPATLFNSTALKEISLSSNHLSGDLPDFSKSALNSLNLSDNSFTGQIPASLSSLKTLTVLYLKGNHLSGSVPPGFGSVEVLDLSSNQFNGSLPSDLGGSSLRYLNLSYNQFSGSIPPEFATVVPGNATVDLSFNNLTGQIPGSKALSGQGPELYAGNRNLCGKPLKHLCIIPSTLSNPPNGTSSISPAIAVLPKSDDSGSDSNSSGARAPSARNDRLRPATIVGITLADLVGIAVLGAVFLYLYQLKKQKQNPKPNPDGNMGTPPTKKTETINKDHFTITTNTISTETHFTAYMPTKCLSYCLRREESEEVATSEARTSSASQDDNDIKGKTENVEHNQGDHGGDGSLVMVDGETELEVETLLKASAFVLGASGASIVYKAVLQDGTTFAVRRLGESWVQRLRDFEGHVKAIAKLRHPNLVRVRGFYWGSDEKLVIYDYVSNGSLGTSAYKKNGSTPSHLPLSVRLKIARGVARGLTYIHEKRFVHGNIKPTNILLTPEMEPIISDLGLSWLVYGTNSCKGGGSARQFGSKRSYDGTQELPVSGSPHTGSPYATTNGPGLSPYQAPESLKNLKPSPKWDVYSFGIVLLELLTGKVYLDRELGQWTPVSGSGLEDKYWVLRIADVALRAEIQGKEEAMMSIFKLGFSCASLVPQKRPSMKETLQVLEKIPLSFPQ